MTIVSSLVPIACSFTGPDSLFRADMHKVQRGSGDTIAKKLKAMKC